MNGIQNSTDNENPGKVDAAMEAEVARASARIMEAWPLRNIPQGMLRVWDERDETTELVLLKGTSVLDKQIELGEYVLTHHPKAAVLSYRFADSLSLQFCAGWSKGTIYDGAEQPVVRMPDAGRLGRVLWNNRRQFEEGYVKGIECIRKFVQRQAAMWKPGLHDMPILHVHGAGGVRGWEATSLAGEEIPELLRRWQRFVKREKPSIACVACENYVKDDNGASTGEEMFTLTFELAVVQHPIIFAWIIEDGALSDPSISLDARASMGQLMLDEDFR